MDLIFILSRINSVKRDAIKRYTARWPTCGNQYSNLSIRPEDDSISFNHIEKMKALVEIKSIQQLFGSPYIAKVKLKTI